MFAELEPLDLYELAREFQGPFYVLRPQIRPSQGMVVFGHGVRFALHGLHLGHVIIRDGRLKIQHLCT